MALPASAASLRVAFDQYFGTARSLKSTATLRRTEMAAGSVGADRILDLWETLHAGRAKMVELAAVPGLGAYARDQFNDPTLDLAAEHAAFLAALDAVAANVQSTFPADGSGYLLARQFGAGAFAYRQFTPAQTATLRGLLSDFEATVS